MIRAKRLTKKKPFSTPAQQYYIAIIREETCRAVDELPISEKQRIQQLGSNTSGYWGYFWHELAYPVGPEFDGMTLAEAARRELDTVDAILCRAVNRHLGLLGGHGSGGYGGGPVARSRQIGYHR